MPASADRPPVSVIVVCANGRHHLDGCLGSLARQTYAPLEVLLVDNASSDGSVEHVRASFPGVRLVQSHVNLGYAAANNLGFQVATGSLLVVLNPDTEVHPDFVSELVRTFDDPAVGFATSRICHFDRRDVVNTCGNHVYVGGLGFCRGLDEPAHRYAAPADVASVSGCAFMCRREVLDRIGGFDEEFFMYCEDTDLSLRAVVAGYRIVYVPGSIVYHKYSLRMTARKFFLLERNRRLTLLKNLRWRTLVWLAPSVWLIGLMMWTYALIHGPAYLGAKVRAHVAVYRDWRRLMARRRAVQGLRRVEDGEVLRLMSRDLPVGQLTGGAGWAPLLAGPVRWLSALASWPARALVS